MLAEKKEAGMWIRHRLASGSGIQELQDRESFWKAWKSTHY